MSAEPSPAEADAPAQPDVTTSVDTAQPDVTTSVDTAHVSDAEAGTEELVAKIESLRLDRSKTILVAPSDDELLHITELLTTQLKECAFEAFYAVGQGDDGEPDGLSEEDLAASIATLTRVCEGIGASLIHLRTKSETNGKVAEYLVRSAPSTGDFMDIRVAVVGNVDAGKSTLLGVLTHGELDNGRGLSRQKLFRHQHEADSGRTSSVSHDILGFGADGTIVNKPGHDGNLDWPQICNDAAKVVTFTDLAGHEKYLKTTVFGLTGHSPAFVMLMIGANAGVIGMTKEHLGLALALQKPVFVVVTKIDMCPPNVLASTLKLLNKILKSAGVRKLPMMINSADDVVDASKNFLSQRLCPIFQVSNVTGQNHDILKMFLNLLRPTTPVNPDKPAEFQIDDTFSVPGVGTVVSGTAVCGTIKVGESLLLGPDSTGEFQSVVIKGIHRRRMPTTEVRGGQAASFALKKIKRAAIRKGMVLIHASANPVAYWEFDAEILILHHPSTIATKYQAMVHVGSVRQTAAILKIVDKDHLRTGDKAICRLRFVRFPECIREGVRIVFREGRTKAIGTIARVVPAEEELLSGADYSNISRRVKSSETTAARLVRAAQEAANPAPAVVAVA